MTGAKVDDGFFDNLKVDSLSWAARGVWVTALSWCARKLSDGRISARAAQLHQFPAECIADLVASGLWEVAPDGNGWVMHDYLDYNPSKAEVVSLRESGKKRAAQSRHDKGKGVCADTDERTYTERLLGDALQPSPGFPSASARANEQFGGTVHDLAAIIDAERAGHHWFLKMTGRTLDFASWRGAFGRIGQKPLHERELVAKHFMATDYVRQRTSRFGPDHALKYWDDFVIGPRSCAKPVVSTRSSFEPGIPSSREEIERMAENNPAWLLDEAAQ